MRKPLGPFLTTANPKPLRQGVGKHGQRNGCGISTDNQDPRNHLQQHNRQGHARKLGAFDKKSESTSEECVWSGPMYSSRVRYIQTYLIATIWYTAQIFPAPVKYTQQLTATINWYIWQGAILRVPQPTLQKPK
jgi:hypothetical protein